MKPIGSNNGGANKKQKTEQLPQNSSERTQDLNVGFNQESANKNRMGFSYILNDTQYFNTCREESLSIWFGAGQDFSLGNRVDAEAGTAVASSQQSLPTSYTITSKRDATQKAKVKDAVTRHDDFFKVYPSKNYNLDMALVKEAVNAFIKHDSIREILLYACCYFHKREENEAIIPPSQVIENAGAIAKAFSKPVEYNEQDARTSIKIDLLKIEGITVGKMNLYTMEEKVKNYQPLKHIFTFLKNGKINSLESLEKNILSHNEKEHNADEFNKLLIKVILNYGDFASPTNSVKLLSKLEELGCGKELLSKLEKLGHNPDITLDLVSENPTNNFQPDSLPPPVFLDVTTLQPTDQIQDVSWKQIIVEFKKSGKLYNAQNQVLYTSDIPKDLLELIIDCKGKFATISYDKKQGMSNIILYYGEGVFIAYLMLLKNQQIDVKRRDISKKFKDYFALALKKLKEKIDVDHKIEFLQAVVTMIEKLDLDRDTLKSIKKTYNKKSTTLGINQYFYNFCAAVNDIVIRKEEAKKPEETRKVDIIYDQKILYPRAISKNLLELIINCNGQFTDISYGGTKGIPDLIKNYGEGVFIAYLLTLKNEQIDVKRKEISKEFKNYFALVSEKLKEKIDVDHKIEFLKAVVTMIGELDLDKDTFKFIEETYNKKFTTVGVKHFYNFCAAVNYIVTRKEEAKKAEKTREVDILYYQKILYLQTIPKNLLELIINYNGQFSDIAYGGVTGIPNLIKNYGEGVFIAYLLALKQKERYTIKPIKRCFELALNKLQEKTDGVKIEFLQVVVTMIGELNLRNDHIISITDAYNKKYIIVDGYDFCDQIGKLKQSKYEFSDPQSVIDRKVIPVDTQLNEFGAEGFLELDLVPENPMSVGLDCFEPGSLYELRELNYSLNRTLNIVPEEPYE